MTSDTLQPAYLLHARDYRDSCLLVELLTRDDGRVSAVARGARRVRHGTSQRAILQPFQPLWVALSGRAELKTLRHVEGRGAPDTPRGRALFSGLYLNELLCRLLHRDDPHPALFADYEKVLPLLLDNGALDVVLRHFELRLLEELGYGFSLETAADSGEAIAVDREYRFDPQRGLMPPGGNDGAVLFRGGDLLAFCRGDYSEAARRALKRLCRLALQPHLGDKPLRSRQLFGAEHRAEAE